MQELLTVCDYKEKQLVPLMTFVITTFVFQLKFYLLNGWVLFVVVAVVLVGVTYLSTFMTEVLPKVCVSLKNRIPTVEKKMRNRKNFT